MEGRVGGVGRRRANGGRANNDGDGARRPRWDKRRGECSWRRRSAVVDRRLNLPRAPPPSPVQEVMSLKGMKKQEQQTILETFGGGVAAGAASTPAPAGPRAAGAGAGGGGGGARASEKASAGLEKAGAAMGSGANQAAAMSKRAAAGVKGAMGGLSKAFT